LAVVSSKTNLYVSPAMSTLGTCMKSDLFFRWRALKWLRGSHRTARREGSQRNPLFPRHSRGCWYRRRSRRCRPISWYPQGHHRRCL